MRVVFLHGPAAAGKHTIGTLLSARLGWPLFHNHLTVDLVQTLFNFGEPGFVRLREQIWCAAFAEAAAAGRSFIFTFSPEKTVDPSLIGVLEERVTSAGGKVLYVELACAEAEVLRRLDNPSRQQFGKLTDSTLYGEIQAQGGFDFPPLPEPIIRVETDQVTPEKAAEMIAEAVRKAA